MLCDSECQKGTHSGSVEVSLLIHTYHPQAGLYTEVRPIGGNGTFHLVLHVIGQAHVKGHERAADTSSLVQGWGKHFALQMLLDSTSHSPRQRGQSVARDHGSYSPVTLGGPQVPNS